MVGPSALCLSPVDRRLELHVLPRASGELQHQLQVLVAIRKNVLLAPAVIKKTAYESARYLLHDGRTAVCLCEALRTAWRQHANLERSRQDWQGPLHWCFRRPKVSLAPAVIKMAGWPAIQLFCKMWSSWVAHGCLEPVCLELLVCTSSLQDLSQDLSQDLLCFPAGFFKTTINHSG